jgi:hypothetical protein
MVEGGMNEDEQSPESLVIAIGELREELIQWIDTRLAALREGEIGPDPALLARPSAGSPIYPGPEMPPKSSVPFSDQRNEARVEPTRSRPVSARERSASTDLEISPPDVSRALEPAETLANEDPRRRLDALARQLGARLRQSEEARKSTENGE